MTGCNNVLSLNTPFVRSSFIEDEADRAPSEAANTEITTVSPTPPPHIQALTTSASPSEQPYAVTFLPPPPTRSTSNIFDHQCPSNIQFCLPEKSTFGTLPSNHFGIGSRYTYETPSSHHHTAKTRIVFMESSPKTTPPKLPRRPISSTQATGGHFTSSYM